MLNTQEQVDSLLNQILVSHADLMRYLPEGTFVTDPLVLDQGSQLLFGASQEGPVDRLLPMDPSFQMALRLLQGHRGLMEKWSSILSEGRLLKGPSHPPAPTDPVAINALTDTFGDALFELQRTHPFPNDTLDILIDSLKLALDVNKPPTGG